MRHSYPNGHDLKKRKYRSRHAVFLAVLTGAVLASLLSAGNLPRETVHLALVAQADLVSGLPDNSTSTASATDSQPSSEIASSEAADASRTTESIRISKDPKSYGGWVLAPALVAILLAVITRQVVPSLVIGILVGAYMLVPCLPLDHRFAGINSLTAGLRLACEHYFLGALHEHPSEDYLHLKTLVFTLVVAFTVGVISRNGGTAGMVRLLAHETASPRRTSLTAWLSGLVLFFDDYSNCMIIGPTMRPLFDRVKLSRAKLAYVIDTTAAPVASLAVIGTWIGAEIGYIREGLKVVEQQGTPEFLRTGSGGEIITGMQAFLSSLPFRFYPILALFMVFLICVTGRDFGPMRRAERRARTEPPESPAPQDPHATPAESAPPRWWLGFFPIAVLVVGTIGILAYTGFTDARTVEAMNALGSDGEPTWSKEPLWQRASDIIAHSDSYISIFYGAILAAFTAVFLTIVARSVRAPDVVTSGLDGMSRTFPAIVILILAWTISSVLNDLKLGEIVVDWLRAMAFEARWVPVSVFIAAALISFATGTSWGTMGILCPLAVQVSANLAAGLESAVALQLFYASVGAVLAGAVFGDHCSPISDTTILSSIGAGCRHEEHVATQLPYAVVVALVAIGIGDTFASGFQHPWYMGLIVGAMILVGFVFLFGRKTEPVAAVAPSR
jgi:Na+/H+ antiporter NhaC